MLKALHASGRCFLPVLLLALAGCSTVPGSASRNAEVLLRPDPDLRFADALAHFSRGMVAQADAAAARAAGRTEDAERQDASALRHFRNVTTLDENQLTLTLQLAWLYVDDYRMYREAIDLLERARIRKPDAANVAILLGYAYQQAGELSNALAEYRRALALKPDAERVYNRAALVLFQQHKSKEALALIAQGLRRVADPRELLLFLDLQGRIAMGAGQIEPAIRCFELVAGVQTNNLAVRELLGGLYNANEQPRRAIALLEPLVHDNPADAAGLQYRLGEAYELAGDRNKSERAFRLACGGDPPRHEPYLALAALLLPDRPADAERVLRDGLKRLPDHPSLHTFLGLLFVRRDEYERAIPEFANAVKCLGAFAEARRPAAIPALYYWYGMSLERSGRFDDAVRVFEQQISALPEMHASLNYLAYMWADKGVNLVRARQYVDRALRLEPDNPAYLDTLGWILFRQGDFVQAERHIRRAGDLLPDDPTIMEHLGDVMHALKLVDAAVKYWRASFLLQPDNPALAGKLAKAGVDVEKLQRKAKPARGAGAAARKSDS